MRAMFPILAACFLTSPAMAAPASSVCPAPQPASNMTSTFASDFTKATELDPHWVPSAGNPYGNPNTEAESYTPSQVSIVANVGLRLTTAPEPLNGKPYKSGGVSTLGKFGQTYGHFEMTARMPYQNGMWPAFWLIPANGTWPPEIDVVEYIAFPNGVTTTDASHPPYFGENPATTLHWKDASGHYKQATAGVDYNINATNVFEPYSRSSHTYAVDWRPGSINFILDGKPIFCSREAAAVPRQPMYMIINDAVSNGTRAKPGWAGYVPTKAVWPQVMDISRVSVSRFNDLGSTPDAKQ